MAQMTLTNLGTLCRHTSQMSMYYLNVTRQQNR
jgi:hypothetical protein